MKHPYRVWIVDDSEADQVLLRMMLEPALPRGEILSFSSAEAAVEALADGGRPSLILLDLSMPGIGGRGFLEATARRGLRAAPVLVFTSSANPDDMNYCYRQGASAFLQKPSDLKQLEAMMAVVTDFWFRQALLPGAT